MTTGAALAAIPIADLAATGAIAFPRIVAALVNLVATPAFMPAAAATFETATNFVVAAVAAVGRHTPPGRPREPAGSQITFAADVVDIMAETRGKIEKEAEALARARHQIDPEQVYTGIAVGILLAIAAIVGGIVWFTRPKNGESADQDVRQPVAASQNP